MNKKGFTLTELLAVIAILAILVILLVPNVLKIFERARIEAFNDELNIIIKSAKRQYIADEGEKDIYSSEIEQLAINAPKSLKYCVRINEEGEVTELKVTNGTYYYSTTKLVEQTNSDDIKKTKGNNIEIICNGEEIEEETPQSEGTLIEGYTFGKYVQPNKFESIKTVNHINVPENAIDSWDASEEKNGNVMAWYTDVDNNGLYELYIGQSGKVIANGNISGKFLGYNNVKSIDLKYLDTSNVTNMSRMFETCTSLTSLDLSNFNTSNVTDMNSMFCECTSLTSLDLSNFNTSKVRDMSSMFQNCTSLTSLDLSNFNTSKVTGMGHMFLSCSSLTSLDVSKFDTSNVTYMSAMFAGDFELITIYVSEKFNTSKVVDYGDGMFWLSYKLKGGNGTVYDSTKTNAEYARIDGKDGLPGYFTLKN